MTFQLLQPRRWSKAINLTELQRPIRSQRDGLVQAGQALESLGLFSGTA